MPVQNPMEEVLKRMQAATEAAKPVILQKMGTIAVNFVHENFRRQGFQGAIFEQWKPRQDDKAKDAGRAILVLSGRLRAATYYTAFADHVTLFCPVPYAQLHNEGGTVNRAAREGMMSFKRGKGGGLKLAKVQTLKQRERVVAMNKHTIGAHEAHYPARPFIGPSPVLNKQIMPMIISEIIAKMPKS